MKIGYARCSTDDQSTDLQAQRLKAAGCTSVYADDGVSGALIKRRQLARCLSALMPGDILVVCSLDRLGRNLAHLVQTIDTLARDRVGFQSLTEAIDTTSAQGLLLFHLLGALAQFERSLIAERTAIGRAAAQRRGVKFGRPRALNIEQIEHARQLAAGGSTALQIAALLRCSRATAYRAIAGG